MLKEHISGLPPVVSAPEKGQEPPREFDINLSITNTEIVLPENVASRDTQAVFLHLTTVLALRQKHQTKPDLKINFENVEVPGFDNYICF